MIDRITSIATMMAAVGCGLTAGVMLAFSVSVMPALRTQPAPSAIATMQQMNTAIVSPVFLTVFLGSAVAAVVAAVGSFAGPSGPSVVVIVGAALFVIGCFGVTMAVNVPLNNALTTVDARSASGAETWADYLSRWTEWNHARTAAATAACIMLTVAVRR